MVHGNLESLLEKEKKVKSSSIQLLFYRPLDIHIAPSRMTDNLIKDRKKTIMLVTVGQVKNVSWQLDWIADTAWMLRQ